MCSDIVVNLKFVFELFNGVVFFSYVFSLSVNRYDVNAIEIICKSKAH